MWKVLMRVGKGFLPGLRIRQCKVGYLEETS